MSSLSARLLVSVSLLLLFFFGATIVVLDTAFRKAGEQAREDILDGHLMQLLAAAEPDADGVLDLPPDLPEARFGNIGSGLYAELRDENSDVVWRSRSALGLDIPLGVVPEPGNLRFLEESLEDNTPLLTLSMAVQWEIADNELKSYVFKVAESLDSFNAQVAGFRRQLFSWFAAVALIMLLSISILMRRLLRPLRQIESEIGDIEEGRRASLSEAFPTELAGVARNMNLLIDSERARSERYRHTLDNLAHSLKTPLAALRALLSEIVAQKDIAGRFDEQIDRMDEIVRYQLRKPMAMQAENPVLTLIPVKQEVQRLIDGLNKVYHDKGPTIETEIDAAMMFRGDSGDFLEIAGNLLDNACKWCDGRVHMTIRPESGNPANGGMVLTVADDGPGIPAEAVDALLQRGTRLDESTSGHGIGLAVIKEIAESYGGNLEIGQSNLGGAEFRVTIPVS